MCVCVCVCASLKFPSLNISICDRKAFLSESFLTSAENLIFLLSFNSLSPGYYLTENLVYCTTNPLASNLFTGTEERWGKCNMLHSWWSYCQLSCRRVVSFLKPLMSLASWYSGRSEWWLGILT
jgi:hypothetical protein